MFTYNCDLMQWSGYWRHAVVGYNAHGDFFDNHPLSGLDQIDTAVACPNNISFQVPWNNLVYKISPPPDYKNAQIVKFLDLYQKDVNILSPEEVIDISEKLEPCPCSGLQAWRDWGRFRFDWFHSDWYRRICFLQRFPIVRSDGSFTQRCCYGLVEYCLFCIFITFILTNLLHAVLDGLVHWLHQERMQAQC